jgi:hypothetical protein
MMVPQGPGHRADACYVRRMTVAALERGRGQYRKSTQSVVCPKPVGGRGHCGCGARSI